MKAGFLLILIVPRQEITCAFYFYSGEKAKIYLVAILLLYVITNEKFFTGFIFSSED